MLPPIARRFVAGETVPVALDHVRARNEEGVKVILNLLGEHYTQRADAEADTDAYCQLVRDVAGSGLEACISVKPTQLGLHVDEGVFRANYRRVVETAADHGVFVWCDMEGADTTDATLDAFAALATEFPDSVGQCLQVNLRRTRQDLARLADVPGGIRLVKGAYDEPEAIAYTRREEVVEAFRENLEVAFQEFHGRVAVGTHDPVLISEAKRLARRYDRDVAFQLLMGVREDEQRALAAEGYDVWQYAPYGRKWGSYFYRRLRERKANVAFAFRAVVGR